MAFDILRSVEAKGAHAADLLHARISAKVKPEDAALATELTLGVLRWQGLLDFLIGHQVKKPSALDPEVQIALRLGLYQLRYLTRVPARAAVNESVELVKRARKRSAAGLVNAVLRRLAETAKEPVEKQLPAGVSAPERLAILHSHPKWMVERWLRHFGEGRSVALLESNNHAPRFTLVVHDPTRQQEARAELEGAGLRVEPGRWLRTALLIEGDAAGSVVARSDAFCKGCVSIQDEASQMIPLLLGTQPGDRVLDVCAAPGGKTIALAIAAGLHGSVVATDISPRRLKELTAQLRRADIENARVVALDAAQLLPFREQFDRILVDAPCSGTGTLGRNPEIRWRLREADLADFHRRQVALLTSAAAALAPGGTLVYATCSLEPEENEHVVAEVLVARSELQRVSGAATLKEHLLRPDDASQFFDANGDFRTFPPAHGADGFFAAVLRRK
jgi:16S rRNA (cytosine967-C5)-methyltransferase